MEVMIEPREREWWAAYRQKLESDFAQDDVVIRATDITRL